MTGSKLTHDARRILNAMPDHSEPHAPISEIAEKIPDMSVNKIAPIIDQRLKYQYVEFIQIKRPSRQLQKLYRKRFGIL